MQKPYRVSKRIVAATIAGNTLEFYDFITYAYFAVNIGKAFFPASTPLNSLLLSVAVFGVGFVSRPLGGLLIGAYADRAGRKPAMLLTVALITVATMGLALTPTYESIGLAAPLLVVLFRLVQGLALGGEIGPSSAFLVEISPPRKRGLYGSWQLASQGVAALLAGVMGMLVTSNLTPEELQAWGWRVPFALGLLLIPVAIYLRREMPETLELGTPTEPGAEPARLRQHTRLIVLGTLIVTGGTVSLYVTTYMTTYAITTLQLPSTTAMAATAIAGISTVFFALLGGWLGDRLGRKPVMLVPRLLTALFIYPAFLFLNQQKTGGALFTVTAILAALTAISSAASLVAVSELLPRRVRAIGISIAYAIGVVIFGGTTQFIVTWLIGVTGDPVSPAWYVLAANLITVVAIMTLPKGIQDASA